MLVISMCSVSWWRLPFLLWSWDISMVSRWHNICAIEIKQTLKSTILTHILQICTLVNIQKSHFTFQFELQSQSQSEFKWERKKHVFTLKLHSPHTHAHAQCKPIQWIHCGPLCLHAHPILPFCSKISAT